MSYPGDSRSSSGILGLIQARIHRLEVLQGNKTARMLVCEGLREHQLAVAVEVDVVAAAVAVGMDGMGLDLDWAPMV
jgi:hypothetical protein